MPNIVRIVVSVTSSNLKQKKFAVNSQYDSIKCSDLREKTLCLTGYNFNKGLYLMQGHSEE